MAGNHFRSFSATTSSSSRSSTSSSLIITVLSLLTITSLYFLFTSSSSNCIIPNQTASLFPNPNPNSPPPLYSFVASLDKFLSSPSSSSSISSRSSQYAASPDSPEELDGRIWKREAEIPMTVPSVVRVYVYDMPAKFTYDLLRMFQGTYRETTNMTSNGSPVHRLIEQLIACF